MKLKSIFCLSLLASALCAAQTPKDTVRILAIGNSFSVDAIENNLHELAAEKGHVAIIGNMYIGGCTLQRHFNNSEKNARIYSYRKVNADGSRDTLEKYSLDKALHDEAWDYVSFQQASPLSGLYETYEPYLTSLIEYVSKRVPKDAVFLFHQTWAYAVGSPHRDFPNYDCNQQKMYDCIVDASSRAAHSHNLVIVPCGTAQQNVRMTGVGDNVNRDECHLNATGRYAAACTWYETIFGEDVRENPYFPATVNEFKRDAVRESAHAAVLEPYKVTDVGHRHAAVNYDENKIVPFILPDALTMADGRNVKSARMWRKERRPELLDLFCREVYGYTPEDKLPDIHYKVMSCTDTIFAGAATRKEVNIYFTKGEDKYMTLMLYIPNDRKKPAPVFLGLNFKGNYSTSRDSLISKPDAEQIERYGGRYEEVERGAKESRWPYEMIIRRGYAVATVFDADIDPDWDDAFRNGVHGLFPKNTWGTLAGWAWGLSRCLDYLATDNAVDESKVAVIGHSRHGKAALWAGAMDTRFAMVISNNSGCGGAALSKRAIGENVQRINDQFPHWFCSKFKEYNGKEQDLPIDQHELVALMAPRPVYVASASEDAWADPKGEFLSAWYASKVYELLGYPGMVIPGYTGGEPQMPAAEVPLQEGRIAYHLRKGPHDITAYDWTEYMNFADRFFR